MNDNYKKEIGLIVDNPALKNFVEDAGYIGIVSEAAFVAALFHSGMDLMKHFRMQKVGQ